MFESFTAEIIGLVNELRTLGFLGAIGFGVIFAIAALALIPASPMTAIAGYLYGPIWGSVLISPAGIVSAMLAFFLGRYLARPWVRRRLERRPKLTALDTAVERKGFRLVLLLRLASIVPFAPLSYSLGASRINSRDFAVASWIGLLPGTFLYAYLGSLASNVEQILRGQAAATSGLQWITWFGLVIALIALWGISRFARHAIRQSVEEETKDEQVV